jgi:Skp family chaperone for outer membrane proteins
MFSDAMNRRSAEAIAMADLASKARLSGDAELTRNIGLLQARLNDANSKINQELETDRKMLSVRMMGFDKAKPEEKAELMRLQQDFLAKLQQAERRYNVPSLKQQLLKLENKSLGTDAPRQAPSTKRFDSSGNPIQ